MNPLGFFSNLLHGTENFVGGLAQNAGRAVGNVIHPQQQRPAPQLQRPTPRPQPQINLAAFAHVLQQIPNVHLQGIEQLTGNHNITVGNVVNHTPVLGQAIKFGQQSATPQFQQQSLPQKIGQFAQGITGAGIQGAGYVVPEAKILKGAGVAARFVNQAAPAAVLSAAGDLVGGNRNAKQIAQNALINGAGAGAINAVPTLLKLGAKGAGAIRPVLANESGHLNLGPMSRESAIEQAQLGQLNAKSNIAALRLAHDNAMADIANGGGTDAQKIAKAKLLADQTNKDLAAHNEVLGAHLADLKQMGVDPITHAPAPTAMPGRPELPKGAAYAGPNSHILNPTLKQKVVGIAKQAAEPFMNPNPENTSLMGVLNNERGTLSGTAEPKIVGNKFTQSVKTSPEVSAEVRGAVSGQHVQRSTEQLMKDATASIQKEGLPKATDRILSELSVPNGQASDTTLAHALQAAKAHDALGTTAGHDMATSLYDQIAEHGVAKGQGVQILSQIARRSPAGLRNKAFKDLKKAGVEVTPAMKTEIQGHIDAISKMPEGAARDFAVAVLQKSVAKHLPQTATGKAISIWKAGLLSGTKTQGGNFLSNATFGALKKASDIPAALVDRGLSLRTGQRTKTLSIRGGSGVGEGLKNARTTMKTGIDMRNVGDKYEQHAEINFKNPILQKVFGQPSNLVFRGMSAADQPFYYASLKNSMYDQAKAVGLTEKLHGADLTKRMNELVQNPTAKMVETATNDAQKSVLAHDTVASKLISGAKRGIDNMDAPNATKAVAHATLDILAPFTKVPSAFLSRSVDFTPLGTGREVFEQIAKKQFDQRKLATAIGEGATGSGIIAMGMALSNSGQLSGDYPKTDPKEAARWKAEGITPNSVKLGGKWISLNYMGPLGMLLGAGNNMADASKQGSSQLAAAAAGFGSGLLNQSFVQGLTGATDAIKNPQQFAQTYLNSQVGSIVPGWMNDIGNATDNMQRQANNVGEAVVARIPGLRQNLAPKIDAFGNDLTQASGSGLNTAVNPLKPSNSVDSPMLSELNRLGQTGKDNVVFPTTVKTIGSGNTQIKLTPDQSNQRQKLLGQALTPLWNQIMQSPSYKTLDDAHKAQALQNALTDINGAVDRTMTAKIDSSKLGKAATGNVAAILSGHPPTAQDYLDKAAKGQNPSVKVAKAKVARSSKPKVVKAKAVKAPRFALKQVYLSKAPKLKIAKAKTKGFKLASSKSSSKSIKLVA